MATNVWIAASEGNQAQVESFFESDPSLKPTSPDQNTYTPLHAAASYAHHDLLRWLLTHSRGSKTDVDVTDEDGDTPLFVVEDVNTAKLLIEEFKADAKHTNNDGLTAAATLHENGFEEVAEYIRGVTGEPKPQEPELEQLDEEEEPQEEQDDERHDGETTKRYVDLLQRYSSCEVSDALIKLGHATGGHLPNLSLTSPNPYHLASTSKLTTHKICGQVYPVQMVSSTDTSAPPKPSAHFVDSAPKDSIMVIQAPSNCENAIWGGLMTARAQHLGVKGVILDGKCRDLAEQWQSNFTIFSKGHSTLGQNPFTRAARLGCSLHFPSQQPTTSGSESNPTFPSATLEPVDLILADVDGVVFVPRKLVVQVVELAEKGRKVDELCMSDLQKGRGIAETFKDRRGK
ncbi:unnamed protein product [Sympodiomycopsis kandeliae]